MYNITYSDEIKLSILELDASSIHIGCTPVMSDIYITFNHLTDAFTQSDLQMRNIIINLSKRNPQYPQYRNARFHAKIQQLEKK